MANKEDNKLLITLLVGTVGYFAILKPILIKLGLQDDPDVKATEARKKAQLEEAIKLQQKQQPATKSIQEWQIIADQIYQDLRYSSLDDNKADAGYQVARVKNNTDFLLLYKFFGKRREYLFGVPAGGLQDLAQFITGNLTRDRIEVINNNYALKNIKFRF